MTVIVFVLGIVFYSLFLFTLLFSYLVILLSHGDLVSLFLTVLKHQIRHEGIFQNGGKHEQKAHHKKPFQGFDVRHLSYKENEFD